MFYFGQNQGMFQLVNKGQVWNEQARAWCVEDALGLDWTLVM